ncbi:WD40 domain containing protein [Trichuris trichiura]|uniref:WD40 domain containing protein n=1 Tax=Trichuris trichiura TaxID=36087 RepID=A0A077ZEG0_TRITR|nr:WD40 domain containing protein [Trichuris trichiura]
MEPDCYGRRMRRSASQARKQVDVTSSILNYIERRLWDDPTRHGNFVTQPHILFAPETFPIVCSGETSAECVMTRLIRSAVNKIKCPIFDLCWTPEGRRLITGGSSGEFTLWNGTAFNFETILQAHDSAVRAMIWSNNQQWMVTSDQDGYVKYWQANMNNVAMFQAHREAVRALSFAPSDLKFATGGDDSTSRIWDFKTLTEERVLRGHGSDVRAVDWHPSKGLLVTGSRDSQQPVKLWDPRTEACIRTLHFHKSGVTTVDFNANGNWLLTGSRDHLIKLIDIRSMDEIFTFKGHMKDVTSVAWHPIQEKVFVSGGADGSLIYWDTLSDHELTLIEGAHEQAIWALDWHPLGHILASGSNDNNTKADSSSGNMNADREMEMAESLEALEDLLT